MFRRIGDWWRTPVGRVPWLVAAAFIVLEGAALWAVYVATGSFYAQVAASLLAILPWNFLRHRSGRQRPLPAQSDLPDKSEARLLHYVAITGVLGAAAVLSYQAFEVPGPWFWFFACFQAPQMLLWNSERAIRWIAGGSRDVAPPLKVKHS
jgi:hypothetical protein